MVAVLFTLALASFAAMGLFLFVLTRRSRREASRDGTQAPASPREAPQGPGSRERSSSGGS
jgi:hypothetical protein